jgi:hypothetical protein
MCRASFLILFGIEIPRYTEGKAPKTLLQRIGNYCADTTERPPPGDAACVRACVALETSALRLVFLGESLVVAGAWFHHDSAKGLKRLAQSLGATHIEGGEQG